jgi:hypothetical protein
MTTINSPASPATVAVEVAVLDGDSDHLTPAHLRGLAAGKLAACLIKNFMHPEVCDVLVRRMTTLNNRMPHGVAHDLEIRGMAYFLVARRPQDADRYYRTAVPFSCHLLTLAAPYGSPLDRVAGVLNDAWPAGAVNERLEDGRRMNPAVWRVFLRNGEFILHQDILADEAPESLRAHSLTAQFGLNIYLDLPESGGELELCLRHLDSDEYVTLAEGSYRIDRAKLGPPSVVVAPERGEMVLFSSRHLHAVNPSRGDRPRVSFSTFVGLHGPDNPLTY